MEGFYRHLNGVFAAFMILISLRTLTSLIFFLGGGGGFSNRKKATRTTSPASTRNLSSKVGVFPKSRRSRPGISSINDEEGSKIIFTREIQIHSQSHSRRFDSEGIPILFEFGAFDKIRDGILPQFIR